MRNRLRSSVSVTIAAASICFDRVGNDDAGHRRAGGRAGGDGAVDQCAGQERPRRIVNENDVGRAGGKRLKSGAHRSLPRRAAGNRRRQFFQPGDRGAIDAVVAVAG